MTITEQRSRLLAGVAWTVVAGLSANVFALPAMAQVGNAAQDAPSQQAGRVTPAAPQSGDASPSSDAPGADIIVTGSRIKRNGSQSPTPETVVTAADIATKSSANIADYVNQLPQLSGSATTRTGTQATNGTVGSNFLNLRALGATRTLILLDGRRMVGSSVDGLVDVNTLPSALVSRVDIVTGGASAAYRSDAVAGVVNFILDEKFEGLKIQVQNGISTYGDDRKTRFDAAFGTDFAGGKGHLIVSGTYADTAGVAQADSRPWFRNQKQIPNPAFVPGNGQPAMINADNAYLATTSAGGLINTGVLAGTQFGAGGAISRRVYGTPAGAYTIGGEPQDLQGYYTLEAAVRQENVFSRATYDLLPSLKVFGEFIYARSHVVSPTAFPFQLGNLTVKSDNAFLPAALRAQLAAAGQASFNYGTLNLDIGRINSVLNRDVMRFAGGVSGKLGGGWTVDAYGQFGENRLNTQLDPIRINGNYTKAIDAVLNPANGQIVCRSTLTNPSDACVPYNLFGYGVNTPAALSYVSGVAQQRLHLRETVGAVTIQGQPFSTWAGPVSLAFGGEYRRESVRGTVDPISQANGFFAGNYKATNGSYDVKEAFAETVIPLAKDASFARSLELNAAARYTSYSTSGGVVTWKAGLVYEPVDGVRLRATRSHDIRAPNLNDLFLGGIVSVQQTAVDNGKAVSGFTSTQVGNPNAKPERADTFTAGIVLRPRVLPNVSFSVDYYDIKIKDAILTLSNQQVIDNCNAGVQSLCASVTRDGSGTITSLIRSPINVASEKERGLDIEASGAFDLTSTTKLLARALASHIFTRTLALGNTVQRLDGSYGQNGGSLPKWRLNASFGIEHGPVQTTVTARYVSPGVYDRAYTAANIADNHIAGATYYDLALSFDVPSMGGKAQFFVNVDNVLNKDPVIVYSSVQPFLVAPVNAAVYDTIGREFRAGFRIKF